MEKKDIQKILDEYHGDFLQRIYVMNEEIKHIDYWYDESTHSLMTKEGEFVQIEVDASKLDFDKIHRLIYELEGKLEKYYKDKNITLLFYDD